MVLKKVCNGYLNGPLPQTRSDLEKALREIQKSTDAFCQLIYRFDADYLAKVQPTFDMLGQMITVILKEGKDENARKALQTLKNCKSFALYWKSLIKR